MEEKEPLKVRLSTVIICVIVIIIIGLVSVIVSKETEENANNIVNNNIEELVENKEIADLLKEKYLDAIQWGFEDFEYQSKEDGSDAEITNYDAVVNSIFTEYGKTLFEEDANLIVWKNNKPYMAAGSDNRSEFLLDVSFENIKKEKDIIKATAVRTMTTQAGVTLSEEEKENIEKYIFKDEFVIKLVDGNWLVDKYTWGDVYETIEEYISDIYIGIDTLIPTFEDINTISNDWVWKCAYTNLYADGKDPGESVTKEQVENSAREVFGNKFNKEFPEDGLEFWLEPKDGEYFVASAGIEPDYFNNFVIDYFEKNGNEMVIDIVEYKTSDIWHEQTELEICNIKTNEVIERITIPVEDIKQEEFNDYLLNLVDVEAEDYVRSNTEKFSKAKLIFDIDEDGKYCIKSVER